MLNENKGPSGSHSPEASGEGYSLGMPDHVIEKPCCMGGVGLFFSLLIRLAHASKAQEKAYL